MTNVLMIVSTVLQMIPSLITAIKAIEEAIPGQGNGEKKLAAIREIVEACHEKARELWPYLEKAIQIIVGVFNSTGVFSKSTT